MRKSKPPKVNQSKQKKKNNPFITFMAKKNTKPTKPTPAEQPTTEPIETDQPEMVDEAEPVAVNGKPGGLAKKKPTPPPPVDLKKPKPDATSSKPLVVKSSDLETTKRKIPLWGWIAMGVVVLGGLAALGMMMFGRQPAAVTTNTTNLNTNSTTGLVPRALDGVLVPASKARTNTYAIMIENITESRPQSGLNKASVVYEALAEGGITRFMALYPVGEEIAEIGPVRSARKYYITYAEEYRPLYVHAGGSPDALTYLGLSTTNVVDFNQFRHGPNFWRDKSRHAPHNLYTSTELLLRGLRDIAPNLEPSFTPWTFKAEPSFESVPEVTKDIVINYSSFNYRVTYTYNKSLNAYTRSQGDTEQVTKDGGKIEVKNVIVQFVKTGLLDGDKQRLSMETVGEGKLLLFQDGKSIVGTWKKTSPSERMKFLDEHAQELPLNPGMTWISVVPNDRTVDY